MTWASVLALLNGDSGDRAAASCGLRIAQEFDANLEGLIIRPDPREAVRLAVDGMSPAMIESVIDAARGESERRVEHARATFADVCSRAEVTMDGDRGDVHWDEEVAIAADRIAFHGRLADMVVVGRGGERQSDESTVAIETVLFETGRPLLIATGEDFPVKDGTMMIAWNGSRESARAVTAVLPLMRRAGRVMAVAVDQSDATGPRVSDLQRYLARHEIAIETQDITSGAGSVPEFLLDHAHGAGADYMVMGAYGRSRLRELILGGVTRRVVAAAAMPVIMVH